MPNVTFMNLSNSPFVLIGDSGPVYFPVGVSVTADVSGSEYGYLKLLMAAQSQSEDATPTPAPILSDLAITGGATVGSTATFSWDEIGGPINSRSIVVTDGDGNPVTLTVLSITSRSFLRSSASPYSITINASGPGGVSPVLSGSLMALFTIPIEPSAWTVEEAVADADTRKSHVILNLPEQPGFRLWAYRGTSAAGNLGQLSEMTWTGSRYEWISTGQSALGSTVYGRIARTGMDGLNPEWISDPADVKSFVASNVPLAPVVSGELANGSGSVKLLFDAPDGRGRTVAGGRWRIAAGAWTAFTGTAELAITGLTDGAATNVGVQWQNANGYSAETVENVTAVGVQELTPTLMRSSITDPNSGVTYNFVDENGNPRQREVGQYFTGDYFVIASEADPVLVGSMDPPFVQEESSWIRMWTGDGGYEAGIRFRNGAMKNPARTRRSSTVAAVAKNAQGFDNYRRSPFDSNLFIPYVSAANVDPANPDNAGAPVSLLPGDALIKSQGYPTLQADNPSVTQVAHWTRLRRQSALIAEATVPNAGAIPAGEAGPSGEWTAGYNLADIDASILPNLDQSAMVGMSGYKTLKQLCDENARVKSSWARGDDPSVNMQALENDNHHFGRGQTVVFTDALMGLCRLPTTGDDAAEFKTKLLQLVVRHGVSELRNIKNGDDYLGGGGYYMGLMLFPAVATLALGNPAEFAETFKQTYEPYAVQSGVTLRGTVPRGYAETKRFSFIDSRHMNKPTSELYLESSEGREFPWPYSTAHLGVPEYFNPMPNWADKWNWSAGMRTPYRTMGQAHRAGMLALFLMTGGRTLLENDSYIQYFDRFARAKAAGQARFDEGGDTQYSRAFWDTFRGNIVAQVPIWTGKPEYLRAPVIERFTGEGTRLFLTPRGLIDNGASVTRVDLRYRTTAPPDTDVDNMTGWTYIEGVAVVNGRIEVTGMTPGTFYYCQIRPVNSFGEGAWTTNNREYSGKRRNASGQLITASGSTTGATGTAIILGRLDTDPYTRTGPQGYASTDANADIANLTVPFIYGGTQVGSILAIDHGTYTIEPSVFTYQWKDDGVNIAGATGRTFDTAGRSGVITCDYAFSNSSSSFSGTTAGVTLIADNGLDEQQIGAEHKSETVASTGAYNRSIAVTGSPTEMFIVNAMAGGHAGGTIEFPDDTNSPVNATTKERLVSAYTQNGGAPVFAQLFRGVYAAGQATAIIRAANLRGATYSMAAFRMGGYDVTKAKILTANPSFEVSTNPDVPNAISLSFKFSDGKDFLVPKDWLVLLIGATGATGGAQGEITWKNGYEVDGANPGLTQIAGGIKTTVDLSNNLRYAASSIAKFLMPETAPLRVTMEASYKAPTAAMAMLAIPPK